ncbi:MAG: SH3 domain-containing protein [Lachnospiraceae bacterium]|nr:SH3 domain-containing protein [Lachnospiraceae bacterium]
MFHINRKILVFTAASLLFAGFKPALRSAAAEKEIRYLMLPTAGIDYILSEERISLRDIEIYEAERKYELAAASAPASLTDAAGIADAGASASAAVSDAISSDALVLGESRPADDDIVAEGVSAEAPDAAGSAVEAIPAAELPEGAIPAETAGAEASEPAGTAEAVLLPEGQTTGETAEEALLQDSARVSAVEKIIVEPFMSDTQRYAVAAAKPAPEVQTVQGEAAGADAGQSGYEEGKEEIAVAMVSDFVYMRAEPSTDAEVVGKLYANGVGHIVGEEKDGWVPVRSGEVTGYVKAQFLFVGEGAKGMADEVAVTKATVTTETLRVRVAPDINSDVITLIPGGETFDVISVEDDWIKVDTPEGMGYISSDYADVEQVYPEAESRAQEEARLAAEAKRRQEEIAAEEAKKKALEAERKAAAARQAAAAAQQAQAANAALLQQQADAAAAAAAQAQQASVAAQQAAAAVSVGTPQGQAVANFALQFVGNPYVYGGSSLTHGTDCSGFTMSVYANFGISLPHYDASQRNYGVPVGSLAEAAPGDLVCYSGHVGIYIGGGQIVHASNPRDGIKVSNAGYRSIVAIRRIFN